MPLRRPRPPIIPRQHVTPSLEEPSDPNGPAQCLPPFRKPLKMARAFVHKGSRESIHPSASPGLVFLKFIIPALDDLGPFHGTPDLAHYLAPNATFAINNGPKVEAVRVLKMLEARGPGLSRLAHVLDMAWDVANVDGSRTVMYKSTSVTVFSEDVQGVEVRMKEFNIMELIPSKSGRGWHGLQALSLMTYLDATPVLERAQAMQNYAERNHY